uniref:Uncharacterized protein n=1 Tax=Monodelphis domestica TaxID=13616 RepID=A0A5F8HJD4_MONDO
ITKTKDKEVPCESSSHSRSSDSQSRKDKMFSLKKWNMMVMWSWDVECDSWLITRRQFLKCKPNKILGPRG